MDEKDQKDKVSVACLLVMTAAYLLFLWDMRQRSINGDKALLLEYKSAVAETHDMLGGDSDARSD